MKIRLVGAELIRADGQTDRHTWRSNSRLSQLIRADGQTDRHTWRSNSSLSQFCEMHLKISQSKRYTEKVALWVSCEQNVEFFLVQTSVVYIVTIGF